MLDTNNTNETRNKARMKRNNEKSPIKPMIDWSRVDEILYEDGWFASEEDLYGKRKALNKGIKKQGISKQSINNKENLIILIVE